MLFTPAPEPADATNIEIFSFGKLELTLSQVPYSSINLFPIEAIIGAKEEEPSNEISDLKSEEDFLLSPQP